MTTLQSCDVVLGLQNNFALPSLHPSSGPSYAIVISIAPPGPKPTPKLVSKSGLISSVLAGCGVRVANSALDRLSRVESALFVRAWYVLQRL
jgi:hypothetical protein